MARTKQTAQYTGKDDNIRAKLRLRPVHYAPRSGFVIITRYDRKRNEHHNGYAWLCNSTQCPGLFTPFSTFMMLNRRRSGRYGLNDVIQEMGDTAPEVDHLFGALQSCRFIGGTGRNTECRCLQGEDVVNENQEIVIDADTLSYAAFDLNESHDVAKQKWDNLDMWYGMIQLMCKNLESGEKYVHFVSFFRLANDNLQENITYYITGGEPKTKLIVTSDLFHLLHSENGRIALLHQLWLPFREEGIEIYFPRNQDNEFTEVVLHPKYYRFHPASYSDKSLDQVKREIIPFFESGNGSVPKKHNFACEIVDVNDDRQVIEIDYEILYNNNDF
jgi:hypothetical protein